MRIHRSVSPSLIRSPVVGPWRSACSSRDDRASDRPGIRARPPRRRPRASTSRSSPGAHRSESPAGRSSRKPRAASRSNSSDGFACQNGKCDETLHRRGAPRCGSSMRRRSRPGTSATSPGANRTAPGPPSSAAPNGSRSTIRRVPSSSSTSTRISGAIEATPSSTGVRSATARPAATTSSKVAPPRAARCISSHTSAMASGAFSGRPRARVSRASWAAVKTSSRSCSVGFSCTAPSRAEPWRTGRAVATRLRRDRGAGLARPRTPAPAGSFGRAASLVPAGGRGPR